MTSSSHPHSSRVDHWLPAFAVVLAVGVTSVACDDNGQVASATLSADSMIVDRSSSSSSTTTSTTRAAQSTPTTTVPLAGSTYVIEDVVVDVDVPAGEELYVAGVGDGEHELGIDPCSECQPTAPWTPLVTSDGRIVIADRFNQRWIVVSDGAPTAVPFGDAYPVAQPVLDAGDLLYSLVTRATATSALAIELVVYDVADLSTPIERHPAQYPQRGSPSLMLDGSSIIVNGGTLSDASVVTPNAVPVVRFPSEAGDPTTVAVEWAGHATSWIFDNDQIWPPGEEPAGLRDGSVLVLDGQRNAIVRLFPSGLAVRQPAFPSDSVVSFWEPVGTVTDLGIVRLERDGDELVVRRYPLPASPEPTSGP